MHKKVTIDATLLDKSKKKIEKLEKLKQTDQKAFDKTYFEYKKFSYSIQKKSLKLEF